MAFSDRLAHAWNAFMNKDPTPNYGLGQASMVSPDRPRFTRGNERSIINSIYNRIAVDASEIEIKHVKLDKEGRFVDIIDSGLNYCLDVEANIDQTGRAFRQNSYHSLLDEGCIAIVPVDTTINPKISGSYDVKTMRIGKITQWFPKHVRVRLYNDNNGKHEEVTLPKSMVSVVQNPFYAVMNEPNSTMQRLVRKLNILDVIDEQSGSGKLDLIIQLPYTIKTDARRQQAELRRKDIENQLANNKFGIAYTDATEHITQLNRSVDNNLMKQIEFLTEMLFSQLGLTQEIMNGTADETAMTNYYNRTIEPLVSAVVDEMKRKFLTKTARAQDQSLCFFRDPFRLVPVTQLAELVDKFGRAEVMSSNEFRQVIGRKPSNDPRADELRNKNLSEPKGSDEPSEKLPVTLDKEDRKEGIQNGLRF